MTTSEAGAGGIEGVAAVPLNVAFSDGGLGRNRCVGSTATSVAE